MKVKFPILILLILLILIYWIWWLPGIRVANDFSLASQATLKSQMSLPYVWSVIGSEGLGVYTVFTLWSYPFNFLNGIFAHLGFTFDYLERILILIPFLFIGILGIWKLGEYLKLSTNAKFVSTFFYLTNTYILLLIDGGQLTIGLAYAFFPLAFLAIEKSLVGGLRKRIVAAFLVSIIGVFDLRFIFVLALLCLIRFAFEFLSLNSKEWFGWIRSWAETTCIILLIYIGLNFYWLLVLFKAPLSKDIFSSLTQTFFVSFTSLGHATLLLSPHWFKNIFGNVTQLRFEFFLIPILVFLAPVLRLRSKIVAFWLLVAITSIFLAKGDSAPLATIYPWLYTNIPGFSLFRDSSKFFFLVSLAYAILLGISTDEIITRINKFHRVKLMFLGLLVAYFIFLIRPIWMGQMTGTFSNPPLQKDYSQLNSLISNDQKSGNIFWIPTISPLTVLDPFHPSVEASRIAQKRPFSQAVLGTYETFNFLREASYMGQLFDVAGIGYIVYPPLDPRRDNLKSDNVRYYYTFLNQLSNLPWLTRINDSKIPLLKVKQHQDKLFIAPNVWWVIGSDDIYKEATKSSELTLSKNALIFAEESAELGKRLDELPQAKIILNHKAALDLAASFLSKSDLIFPANRLKHDPDASGWWKRETVDLINWKDFLKTKYGINNQDFDLGGGWAVGEGNRQLTINIGQLRKGDVLLTRVLESTRSGQINFYQSEKLIGQVNTKSPGDNMRWFEVGDLIDDSVLTIKTQGDINVVNALALVSASLWQEYKDKAKAYQDRVVNFGKGISEASVSVSYKQINPTKYIVTTANLKQSSFLVFSQNFDNNWKLDGKSPFPVYSFLNGYSIEKNGQYELSFEPQKYILPGLIISGLTLVVSLLLLLV